MKEIKVKNVIVSTIGQEKSENFINFLNIVKEKKINVIQVKAGEKINIEKELYFFILAPFKDNLIAENSINNNSVVCKLVYKEFSMLFTGDIEETAEKLLIKEYGKTNILKSTVLKVRPSWLKNFEYTRISKFSES